MGQVIREKLNDTLLKKHQKLDTHEIRDPSLPLAVRFHKSRDKASVFYLHYHGGRCDWKRLGHWPISVSVSRIKKPGLWSQIQDKILLGQSLSQDDLQSVKCVLTWYQERIEKHAYLSKPRKSSVKSIIKRQLLPNLGRFSLLEINETVLLSAFIEPLTSVYEAGSVVQYYKTLKMIFEEAVEFKLIRYNPFKQIQLRKKLKIKRKKGRCLINVDDLAPMATSMQQAEFEARFLVLTMLAYGFRIGEARQLKYSHIEIINNQWHLPGTITKTGEPLLTPLSAWYQECLDHYRGQQWEYLGYEGPYLFPNTRGNPITPNKAGDLVRQISQQQWTAHHLRKLARSQWQEQGVDYFVGERLLNHALKDLDDKYLFAVLQRLKREAINEWHKFLAPFFSNINQDRTKIAFRGVNENKAVNAWL